MRVGFGHICAVVLLSVLLSACGGKGGSSARKPETSDLRKFPSPPSVPSMVTDPHEKGAYVVGRFWDEFLSGSFRCDSLVVNGVPSEEVESAVGRYVTLLETVCDRSDARKAVEAFFLKVSDFQASNQKSNVFPFFEEMMYKYLYDPNSPVRDEDLYLHYVKGLSTSALVPDDKKPAYARDVEMCSLNQIGAPAADIQFTGPDGRRRSLYAVKAENTLLFFSNPGCPACEDVIRRLTGDGKIDGLIRSGKLAVVNLYIDQDIDKWRASVNDYPGTWINGYDQDYKIRQDLTYNVRAIPSLYILDRDKTVIMKDVPPEKALPFLENIQ